MNVTERAVIVTEKPRETAEAFRLRLALDKGFTSDIRRSGGDLLVVASDGQAVRFTNDACRSHVHVARIEKGASR